MIYRISLFTLLIFFATACVQGQQLDYRQGELIVQFADRADKKDWFLQHAEIESWQKLGTGFDTYLVRIDFRTHAENELRDRYLADRAVRTAQLNHRVTYRRRPNDPRYNQQWQMRNTAQINGVRGADYNIEAAWDVTTGGVTPNGDTIVVASLDNGVDLDHEDLQRNLWINQDEVAGNNIDDDNNGYIDDRFGWNTNNESNDIEAGRAAHGTPVMGQIGADGNNGKGVSGVNWKVKVMNINNDFNFFESEVIQSYSYVLEARQKYDATDGREGAYVVATNASWGRDLAFPSESPIWCSLYDTLGSYGILSVAAVPNKNIDVEMEGDLPSLCTSEYLLAVTNVNTLNRKVLGAAYGANSVDLGAYGEEVFTTLLGNTYGSESGTSFAAPAVTGTIGLLHSAPCTNFAQLADIAPAAAALYLKDLLLRSVRPNPDLVGITTSGGSLDIGTAMSELMNRCNDCIPPVNFVVSRPNDTATELVVSWASIKAVNQVTLRYRPTGSSSWISVNTATPPYRLTNLSGCSTYDVQLLGDCGFGQTGQTAILTVETRGCCRLPEDFRAEPLNNGNIRVSWLPLLAARTYNLRYRGTGPAWTEIAVTANQTILTGLNNCETYELELQTDCDTLVTTFQGRTVVQTSGCGTCIDVEYCEPQDLINNREWIAEVYIPGILNNVSGKETNGFTNFGDLTTGTMVPGGVYPINLLPGFPGNAFTEKFRVWVDWNQDGFLTSREVAANLENRAGEFATANITVPPDAKPGLTRMRILMEFPIIRGIPCPGGNSDGEGEDYCLRIANVNGCPAPGFLAAEYVPDNDLTALTWGASAAPGGDYLLRYRETNTTAFTERTVANTFLDVAGLNLCGSYEVQVASLCNGDPGNFRRVFFGDNCVSTDEKQLPAAGWSVAPNPARSNTHLRWNATISAERMVLYGTTGRQLRSVDLSGVRNELEISLSELPAGVYLVRITDADGRSGVKRLVVSK